jgi:hypothetical protein
LEIFDDATHKITKNVQNIETVLSHLRGRYISIFETPGLSRPADLSIVEAHFRDYCEEADSLAWDKSFKLWANFVIKTWPSRSFVSQVRLDNEESILMQALTTALSQQPIVQKTIGLPAPTVAIEEQREPISRIAKATPVVQQPMNLPSYVTLKDTTSIQLKIDRKYLEGINSDFLKIDLNSLPPRSTEDAETANSFIYGIKDNKQLVAAQQVVEAKLKPGKWFEKFDPFTHPELAIQWYRDIEQLCNHITPENRLLLIAKSASDQFLGKIETLLDLKMVQSVPIESRYRWILALMRIEFSKDTYLSYAQESLKKIKQHPNESLREFASRLSKTLQATQLRNIDSTDATNLIDKFIAGLTDAQQKRFAESMGQQSFSSLFDFVQAVELDLKKWNHRLEFESGSIVLNAVETRQKRPRTDEDSTDQGWHLNKSETSTIEGRKKDMNISRSTNVDVQESRSSSYKQNKGKNCFRCDVAGHGFLQCTAAAPSRTRERCMRCGYTGHETSACDRPLFICGRCGDKSHHASVCFNQIVITRPNKS